MRIIIVREVQKPKEKQRGTPKVITSPTEANEYLSTKGRIPVVSRQTEEPISVKRAPEFLRNCADRSASKGEDALKNLSSKAGVFVNSSGNSMDQNEKLPKTSRKNWVEDNFQQFDSIIEKIGIGFQDNYMLAKIKAQENPLSSVEIGKLSLWGEDKELEWMKDENLLESVFQVRENELAGRGPFYSMDAEDQQAFFHGLDRKVEKVNKKLAGVHEWTHSKIENLDYGTDDIGLDDPLEKVIPRWKGPPIDQDPESLERFIKNGNSVLGDKHYGFRKS
ncbi:hypothetical protein KSP40_PGU020844 [Platanthera guangdongensis]|uniref:Uncharacterized protein n=1 Tax=Platanthera guangdongensis TaxID=2320717 RepID=A0ABR2M6R4_9ASPA